MKRTLHRWLLLISLSKILAKDDADLPLCPTNLQYFPQNLPMHCRMPGNSESRSPQEMNPYPTLPPLPQSFYQSPSSDKQPPPVPIPIPPFPGMPGPMGPMGGVMPGIPGAMPMPVPIVGGPPHKLPVIVMPFYSPDHSFKQRPHSPHHKDKKKPPRKKKNHDSDTDASDEDTDCASSGTDGSGSSEHGFWKGKRRNARKRMTRRFNKRHRSRKKEKRNKNNDLLTPILQYVTKEGYVIFEKKISKNEAKDWLKPKNGANELNEVMDEVKPEEKSLRLLAKSAEEPPKVRPKEETPVKHEENSVESEEVEQTTKSSSRPRPSPRKHRPRSVNPLLNLPDI